MIWLMEILKIYLEEQPLLKYCGIFNRGYLKGVLIQRFTDYMTEIILVLTLQLVLLHVHSQNP